MAVHTYGAMNWQEIDALDRKRTAVIWPVGSVEQHGLHMPVMQDSNVSMEVSTRIAGHIDAYDWLILPQMIYGYAKCSEVFPGTISVDQETLRRVTHDIVRGITRQGFRKILIVSANYENAEPCIEGACEVLEKLGEGKAILFMWWEFISEDKIREVFGDDWGGWQNEHAGMSETSLMLHCRPETVRLQNVRQDNKSPTIKRFRVLPHQRSLFPTYGTSFNPKGCTAKRGKELLDAVLAGAKELVESEFKGV